MGVYYTKHEKKNSFLQKSIFRLSIRHHTRARYTSSTAKSIQMTCPKTTSCPLSRPFPPCQLPFLARITRKKDNPLLGRYGIKNDTKVKKMAKMFAHYQKLCIFATELKEKTSEMNKSVFAAWWWRYSRLEQS